MKISRFITTVLMSASLLILMCNSSFAGVREKIFNEQATIEMPEDFIKISNKAVEQGTGKKVSEMSEIWMLPQEQGRVMLLLQISKDKVSENQVSNVAKEIANKSKNSGAVVSPVSDTIVNGKKVSRFIMTSNSPHGKLVSFMQLSSINGLLLKANFLVAEDLKDKYFQLAEHTLSTLDY